MVFKGAKWFSEMGNPATIGVVLVEFNSQEMQQFDREFSENAFIGTGFPGASEAQDMEKIVMGGARFPVAAARLLIEGG